MASPGPTMAAAAAERERKMAAGTGNQRRPPRPLAARRIPAKLGGARSLPRPQPQALHTAPPHGWSGRRSEVERRVEPAALSRP